MTKLYTIGYEGRAQHDVLTLLDDARIELLADVRIRSQSRKPGMSKSSLAAGLAEIGIDYLQLRDLGTPPPIKAEFHAKHTEHARELYLDYLHSDTAAQLALDTLLREAKQRRTAILCFEHDPRECHRMVIAEELHRTHHIEIVHLGAPAVAAAH